MSRYRRLFINHFPLRLPASRSRGTIYHPFIRSVEAAVNFEHIVRRALPQATRRRMHDIKTAGQAIWLQALLVQTRLAGDIGRSHKYRIAPLESRLHDHPHCKQLTQDAQHGAYSEAIKSDRNGRL
jgi:hypothetical protein